ncbi:MAG: SDR family NAD(P)-dependent oxidoreductase, partial [Rhodococcus sp.]|nr:SDR family NAD(P)-dependent oxidoreductase [Rhodococcus sp. (in: high G+C Gram-positive bacteria)]
MRSKTGRPSYGSRAVVTGAGSGIGRAFALELARRGGAVMCADISLPRAQEAVAMVNALGGTGYAVECDVSIRENVEELA